MTEKQEQTPYSPVTGVKEGIKDPTSSAAPESNDGSILAANLEEESAKSEKCQNEEVSEVTYESNAAFQGKSRPRRHRKVSRTGSGEEEDAEPENASSSSFNGEESEKEQNEAAEEAENENENENDNDNVEEDAKENNEEEDADVQISEPSKPAENPRKKRRPQTMRCMFTQPISPKRPHKGNDEDRDKASAIASQLLTGNEVEENDPVILARVIHNLNERSEALKEGGTHDDYVRCNNAIDAAKAKHRKAVRELAKTNSINYVNLKKQQNQEDFEKWRSNTQRMQGTLHRRSKNLMEELKRKHQKEREMFEEEWASNTRMRYYNKASEQLRSLRKLHLTLLADRKYQECERIKLIAEKLEKDEIQGNMVQWNRDKKEALALLERKQKNEIDTLNRSIDYRKTAFLALRKREERVLNNRVNALKIQEQDVSDPDKNWARYHRKEGDVAYNEIGYERRLKVNIDKNKNEINFLQMPTPPKQTPNSTRRSVK